MSRRASERRRRSAGHRRGGGARELTDAQREAVEALAAVIDDRRARDALVDDARWPSDPDRATRAAVYVISVAAELAGVHPQTLRIYERKGLLDPPRTAAAAGATRERDIDQLRRIQDLTNAGPQPGGRPAGAGARGRGATACAAELEAARAEAPRRSSGPIASTAGTWCRCRQTAGARPGRTVGDLDGDGGTR